MPNQTFKVQPFKRWHVLGDAEWQVSNGKLTGKAKANSNGGWIMFDNGCRDIGVKTGVIVKS